MVTLEPIRIGEHTLLGVVVQLPKTTLISISSDKGYIMCGAENIRGFGSTVIH